MRKRQSLEIRLCNRLLSNDLSEYGLIPLNRDQQSTISGATTVMKLAPTIFRRATVANE